MKFSSSRIVRRRRRFKFEGLKRRWPAILLATLLSLILATVVVRTAMIYSLGPRANAASFAPNHPRVLAARIDWNLTTRRGLVTNQTRMMARQLAHRAPMLEAPMIVDGIDRLLANDGGKAKQLFSHAVARNPRSELARLLMLELDFRSNDVTRAVVDMTVLGRLLPDVQKYFVPELARMASDRRNRRALAVTLRSDPAILAGVLRYLAEQGASPRLVLDLAGTIPTGPPPHDIPDWREPLLRSMVGRGDVQAARRLWAAFSGMTSVPREGGIYDEGFRGLPGLAPFNWSLSATDVGVAELLKDGGLQIEYYGRNHGELATQLIGLTPGRYRLAFRAEGDIHDPLHRLFWRMHCARPDNAVLVELPIADLTFAGRTIAGDFSVPPDCPAQWIRLVGEPTEFPKIESVTVRQIRIARLGNGS